MPRGPEGFGVGRAVDRRVATDFVDKFRGVARTLGVRVRFIETRQDPGVVYATAGQLKQHGWNTLSRQSIETHQAGVWDRISEDPPEGLDVEQLENPLSVSVHGADFSLKQRQGKDGLVTAILKVLDEQGTLGQERDAFRTSQDLPALRRPSSRRSGKTPQLNLHLASLTIIRVNGVDFEPLRQGMAPHLPAEVVLAKPGTIQ